jgi:carboxyl-terminal processing protease
MEAMVRHLAKHISLRILFLSCTAALVSSLFAGGAPQAKDDDVYKSLDILCDVIAIVQRDYIEPMSSEKLIQDAIKGMLGSLDSYSHVIPRPEPQTTPREAAVPADLGTYGLEVAYSDRLLTVVAPVEGGPAWKSGVKSGDVIIKINEESIDERPLVEMMALFRTGTAKELRLQVVRRGERDFLTFTLKPGKIEGPSARSELLGENIGLLRISRFDRETAARVAECLKKLTSEGADSLVLDLRDCPAGDMGAALGTAEYFLPPGELITSIVGRAEGSKRDYRSKGAPLAGNGPVVVLINSGTSGAAEVLAGALRGGKKSLLMGQKSFGCAFEEGSFSLKDSSVLKMITAVYYTPDGDQIQDEGLDVDVEVPLPPLTAEDEEGRKPEKKPKEKKEKQIDPMVQQAIDLIKGIRIIKLQEKA